MDLIIVRHGRPVRQELAEGEGTADPELSELGQQQANMVADFLAGETVDHIVASPMRRAHQTSLPLAAKLGIEVELLDGLREVDHHESSYVPAEEMTEADLSEWSNNPFEMFDVHGGVDAFQAVVVEAFDHIIASNRGRQVAVFCHGMVMAVYLRSMLGFEDPFSLLIDYTGIARVRASSTGIRTVRSINETGHVRDTLG